MSSIHKIFQLGNQWPTQDPFLFCAFHHDFFPKGNGKLGPDASLEGRNLGQDFANKDGWNMYHGQTVPGFPHHPHRGFETVTIVEKGIADHFDSLGAKGRFGKGDVQWMTAGKGVQHSEMFPLLKTNSTNELLLFQIWLNLPSKDKMVNAHYKMLWNEDIPIIKTENGISIKLIAGYYNETKALAPTPNSWASNEKNNVGIWIVTLDANAEWRVPNSVDSINRSIYFFEGGEIKVEGYEIPALHGMHVNPEKELVIKNGNTQSKFLLIQGKPIGEPVAQQGPFVMNTYQEINEAIMEYRKTEFGGWPWDKHDPTNEKEKGRFALHADGREETK